MRVGKVGMRMRQRLVTMPVRVPRARCDRLRVLVLMVVVVDVLVRMREQLVRMPMFVTLGQVEPHAYGHERARCE